MHLEPSPLAGKSVRIREGVEHPQVPDFAGSEFHVEDWWDRVAGKSWMDCDGNPACMVYAIRTGTSKTPVPTDNEVLYGHMGPFGHLVHVSEIEQGKEPEDG